jgi:acyl-CoA thioesterase YciA
LTGEIKHTRDPAIRVVLLPKDTNSRGTIFGGIILSYIDLAGAAQVSKLTQQRFVTVAMNAVVFKAPVLVGEIVSFYTVTTKVGRTSVSVHVDVEVDRAGKCIPVTEADLTYVCVDTAGLPIPVEYPAE